MSFQVPVTASSSTDQLLDIHEPIAELACTSLGGPCFGENGEVGFSTRSFGSYKVKKKTYWLDEKNAHLASFAPIIEQACTADGEPIMPLVHEKACTKAGEPIKDDFQFPSWDQLPVEFQNPTSSADYTLTIPISASGAGITTATAMPGDDLMNWDDADMNFAMDMDLDFDLNTLG